MIMISLIGEQPIPNLLPVRHLLPEQVLLVYTKQTHETAERLKPLLPCGCQALDCLVSAFDLEETARCILASLQQGQGAGRGLLFNLTGGTKVMSLAAYQVAAQFRAPFIYLQSEGRQSRLYRYGFDEHGSAHLIHSELLPSLITIHDYLRAHVGAYQYRGASRDLKGDRFEKAIYEALGPVVDEITPAIWLAAALEVDMVVRCANQVGIIEAKAASPSKQGIDQLTTAGARQYLGTYALRFLLSDRVWDDSTNLKALAAAQQVELIELPSHSACGQLSPEDVAKLRRVVCAKLGREVKQ
jgi:hypothetical protein